jgi:membrane protease YdiL (CAAX protease family)
MSFTPTINTFISRIGKIPFLFFLFAIAIYFLINGAAHFPEWDSTYGTIIIYYVIMIAVFLFFANKQGERAIDVPLHIASYQFFLGFVISFMAMTLFVKAGLFTQGTIAAAMIWPTIIMQFCVVAPSEELMFRGVILSHLHYGMFGIVIQAILFAIWHSYAYGIVWYNFGLSAGIASLLIAFIFGIVLGYLSRLPAIGLAGVVAIHAVYNCVLLGIFIL